MRDHTYLVKSYENADLNFSHSSIQFLAPPCEVVRVGTTLLICGNDFFRQDDKKVYKSTYNAIWLETVTNFLLSGPQSKRSSCPWKKNDTKILVMEKTSSIFFHLFKAQNSEPYAFLRFRHMPDNTFHRKTPSMSTI